MVRVPTDFRHGSIRALEADIEGDNGKDRCDVKTETTPGRTVWTRPAPRQPGTAGRSNTVVGVGGSDPTIYWKTG